MLYADPPLPEDAPAPTGVAAGTCFRQVEFAGVLRGIHVHPRHDDYYNDPEIRRNPEVRRAYLGDDHVLERPEGVSPA